MIEIRSLLAATDFSDDAGRAVRRAAGLARELGARLELLHVISASRLSELRGLLPDGVEAEGRVVAHAKRMMGEVAASLEPAAAQRVEVGDLPGAILDAAREHDMLVLGARGERAIREALLGSTAYRLLHKAERPTLVVRREPDAIYRRVVVPCEYAPPARRALELALRVAPHARITLIHAYEVDFESTLWRADVPRDQVERLRAAAATRTHDWLAELQRGLEAAARVDTVAEHGNPRRAILGLVESAGADLVVMGKQGRSMVGDAFLGSVTRQVLNDAKCDVLVAPASGAPA